MTSDPAFWAQRLHALTGQDVSLAQAGQMQAHWDLVCQWAPRLNLTASQDALEGLERHFADALQVLPCLRAQKGPWADIGSGAGFPGIPLAIMRPETRLYLVEPRHRRAAFLQVVAARLGLSEVRILNQKAQAGPPEGCQAVVTRATFAHERELAGLMAWLLPGGRLVAQRAETPLEHSEDGEKSALGAPRRHFYDLGGRRRSCDVWIQTPR